MEGRWSQWKFKMHNLQRNWILAPPVAGLTNWCREILMGVGDTVASVIMLTQFECARPPCWHSLSVPGAHAYIAHSVWVSPAPMLTQFVWSPAPHADTNLKLKQWNNLKYLLFQTKQLRWDMNSGNQLSRQPKYRQQLKFQSMKIVCLSE